MQLRVDFLLIVKLFWIEVASSKVNKAREPHRAGLGQTWVRATGIFHPRGMRNRSYLEPSTSTLPFSTTLSNHSTVEPKDPNDISNTPPRLEEALTRGKIIKMGLEAVMVIVDNSESSRNGDYTPTRFEAQADAVSLIFSAITQANPESSVGLMSMGGKGPEVLVTLTTDHGKILEGLHRTKSKIRGDSHLATGIQIAGVRPSFLFPH